MDIEFIGFEGILFYIYCPFPDEVNFDILLYKINKSHNISNLKYASGEEDNQTFDFILIPFGHLNSQNKLFLSIKSDEKILSYTAYAWAPSSLFKKMKSIIRIDNEYSRLNPITDYYSYYFTLANWFKANETNNLFNIINLLVNYEFSTEIEPDVNDIKELIHKSNEYMFELSDDSEENLIKNFVMELKRLKNNVSNLSRNEVIHWLDDIIDYYAEKAEEEE